MSAPPTPPGRPRDPGVDRRIAQAALDVFGDAGWAGFAMETARFCPPGFCAGGFRTGGSVLPYCAMKSLMMPAADFIAHDCVAESQTCVCAFSTHCCRAASHSYSP